MNRLIRIVGGLAIICAGLWLAGWIWFASTIPTEIADTTTTTDAIVVLTGGSGRVEMGLELLRSGRASKLFVSGTGGPVQVSDLVPGQEPVPPDLHQAISLGREANDTPGNAQETAAWVEREHINSIRLVTAAYHMRRSILEFQTAMPDVKIIAHPVFPSSVKPDWWRWPGTANLIAREYTKFLLTQVRITMISPPTSSKSTVSKP